MLSCNNHYMITLVTLYIILLHQQLCLSALYVFYICNNRCITLTVLYFYTCNVCVLWLVDMFYLYLYQDNSCLLYVWRICITCILLSCKYLWETIKYEYILSDQLIFSPSTYILRNSVLFVL